MITRTTTRWGGGGTNGYPNFDQSWTATHDGQVVVTCCFTVSIYIHRIYIIRGQDRGVVVVVPVMHNAFLYDI